MKTRHVLLAGLALAFSGCLEPTSVDAELPDCAKPCGEVCCLASETCDPASVTCKPAACTPKCTNKACGDDGCGGSCGSCDPGYACQNASCIATDGPPDAGDNTPDASNGGADGNYPGTDASFPGPDASYPGLDASVPVPDGGPLTGKCAAPTFVALTSGAASFTSDTTSSGSDYRGTCGGSGNDVVYAFTLSQTANVTISAATKTSGYQPALFLRKVCGSALASDEAGCTASPVNGIATLTARGLPAGTYYLFVDGFGGTAGQADVKIGTSSAPANDSCASAGTLSFVNGLATVFGDTTGATDDTYGTCSRGPFAPDLVYAFTLTTTKTVSAKLTADASSPDYAPSVYIRSSCASTAYADEKGCGVSKGFGVAAMATGTNLPAGTYYVWVDGYYSPSGATSAGKFRLDVTQSDPPVTPANDTCASAEELVFTNGVATSRGDLTLARNDLGTSCYGSGGNDVVYSFAVTGTKNVEVVVTPNTAWSPVIAVRSMCASSAGELGCAYAAGGSGTAARLLLKSVPAGTYFLVVDSASYYGAGAFDLAVTQSVPPPPPANDACSGAQSVSLVNGVASVTGDLTAAVNDASGTCAYGTGADAVYAVTLAQTGSLTAEAIADNAAFQPVVYVRSICASGLPQDEKACASRSAYGSALATARGLAAGTYYVWVDTASGTGGKFKLNLSFSLPPANDSCLGATDLNFNGTSLTTTGDLSAASNDATGSCMFGTAGPDLVNSFSIATTKDVTVKVTAANAAFQPAVYLRSACSSTLQGDEKLCASRGQVTGTASGTVRNLPAGTYYLWVDNAGGGGGKYTLDLSAVDSPPLPTNDTCASPSALTFVNGVATVSGDLTLAINDTSGSCSYGTSGGDLVYSFTIAAPQSVTVKMTDPTTYTFTPATYLRAVCTSTSTYDERGCSTKGAQPGVATFTVPNLAAGTYYVFADSYFGTGKFTLEVSLAAPVLPPTNDSCGSPETLSFVNDVATASGDLSMARNDMGSVRCGSGGADVVYTFTTTQPWNVDAVVTPKPGATWTPMVYVRKSTCIGPTTDELQGAACGTSPAKLSLKALPAGTYYLVVDSYYGAAGAFDLSLTRTPPPPPPANDTCSAPTAMTFANGAATARGDLTTAADDTLASCGGMYGGDVVYSFTLTTTQRVTATVTKDASNQTWTPVVSIRGTSCSTATDERACAVGSSYSPAITAAADYLAAGTYYVVVDSYYGGQGGPFTLDLAQTAAIPPTPPDNCDATGSLTFVNDVATVSGGSTKTLKNDTSSVACGGSSTPDGVYAFTLSAEKKVTITASSPNYSPPTIYVRSACRSRLGSDEKGCGLYTGGGTTTLTVPNLAAGTYYLWVDGYSDYNLSVTLSTAVPRPANDTCATPDAITAGQVLAGSTYAGTNDYGAGPMSTDCSKVGYAALDSPDVVYKFTPATTGNVTVTVSPMTSTYNPVLWVTTGTCAGTGSACIAASDAGARGQPENLLLPVTANTAYYIVVDGYRGEAGDFFISVR